MPSFGSADNSLATLRRLVRLRWLLLGGEFIAILAVPPLLDIPLPAAPLLAVLGLHAVFNAVAARRLRAAGGVSALALNSQITMDLLALGVLLFLTGGAANPLVSLLLLPVAAAALVLPWPLAAAAAVLAIGLYSLLAVWFVPLHIADTMRATSLHLAGMWLTFVVSVLLICWLIVRMTASIRERDAALAAAREQALRDERVVALGGLAAGAAHELGTPLATMAVIVGELEHDATLDAAVREDVGLLREQIAACKKIVTGLADRAGAGRLEAAQAVAADHWLERLLARWRASRPRAASVLLIEGDGVAPEIVVDMAIEQALGNLLNNAANADGGAIEVALGWGAAMLFIEIRDGGPGFPTQVLEQAGQTPLASGSGGAGIGLLLTHATIERCGGRLTLANRPAGGGVARVELPLARILAKEKAA